MPYKRSIRLKGYDYSTGGAYFVTISVFRKWKIINKVYKKLLKKELFAIERRFPGVMVDFYVFMQNHLHVIFIFKNSQVTLPKVIQAFKSITTLKIKRSGYKGSYFWQKNYYEHIIRDENELNRIRKYIMDNPEKEKYELEKH